MGYSPRGHKESDMTEQLNFQIEDGKNECQHFRNQQTKMDWNE